MKDMQSQLISGGMPCAIAGCEVTVNLQNERIGGERWHLKAFRVGESGSFLLVQARLFPHVAAVACTARCQPRHCMSRKVSWTYCC